MKWIVFTFFWICYSGIATGQTADVKSWLKLERDSLGRAVVLAQVQNLTKTPLAYSYSMTLDKKAPSGNVLNTQSGSFTLVADMQKTLASIVIDLTQTSFFEIKLKVFDDQKVLTEQSIISDNAFLNKFKSLSPQYTVQPNTNTNINDNKTKASTAVTAPATDAIEIEGLIIDETRSKSGRDFYDFFYSKWSVPAGAKDFTITIRELPARGRVARVAIEVNGSLTWQRMVQPRADIIELLAEQAVSIVQNKLSQNETLKRDLESGDQQGSGIF